MRKSAVFLLALIGAMLVAGSAPCSAAAQSPIGLYGRWTSTQYAGAGGAIQLNNLALHSDGSFVGQIMFTGSPCANWAQFSGRVYGNSALISMYVGSCGLTEVTLTQTGGVWVGTYRSQYPDVGVVQMVQ